MQNFAKPARNQIRKVVQKVEETEREWERETRTHSGVCFGFNQQKDKRHKVFSVFYSFYFAVAIWFWRGSCK